MTSTNDEPRSGADLRGPGDPDEAARQQDEAKPQPAPGAATNIREEQQTAAPGTVPPSYVGSGSPGAEPKPEEAADETGMWDDQP
jgi:hypothetical protein